MQENNKRQVISKLIDNIKLVFLFALLAFIIFLFVDFFVFNFKNSINKYIIIFIYSFFLLFFFLLFILKYISALLITKKKFKNEEIETSKKNYDNKFSENVFSDFSQYEEVSYIYISPEQRLIKHLFNKYKKYFLSLDIEPNIYKKISSIEELCKIIKSNFRKKIKLFHPDIVGHDYYKETTQEIQESFNELQKNICNKKDFSNK